MKTILKMMLSIIVVSLLLGSCKVSYINSYHTYLYGSPNESLIFRDSIISISFDPRSNGIYFDIENLTKNNLYLIWDKSYFIEPSGNSSKTLNTDILETTSSIRDKENNESVIPQGAHFKRFTCSAKNVSLFSLYNSITFYNEVTKTINSYTDYSKFYQTGSYWYLGSKRDYESKKDFPNLDKQEIAEVSKFVKNNDNLGFGITIKNKENNIEYNFKFPISKVEILKKTNNDLGYVLNYELSKSNKFLPVSVLKK
jgi:hypothetical protein